MIVEEKNQQSSVTEENVSPRESSPLDFSGKKSTLKKIKVPEENSPSNYYEETESLKYDSSYKALPSENKNNTLRKSSTLSTNVSQSEAGMDNNSPQKSNKECSSSSLLNFGRERFVSMSISNYYDGIDNYFKGLYPEKNDYQKSNNYLEKKRFFREHYPSVDINLLHKERQKEKQLLFDNISKNQPTINGVNPQCAQNFPKIEFPIYYIGYCGIDCKFKLIIKYLIIFIII